VSPEAAVIAVAAALYLLDCAVLLERGQALWSSAGLAFGSLHYQLRGRAVALLNPLTPFVATFRTLPLFSAAPGAKPADAMSALSPLSVLALIQLLLILAVLPYCLLRAPGWPFFAALALAYANALALIGLLWWRLRRARIPARPLAGLVFGWLVCLPLSINALRKAALAFDIELDAREAIGLLPERDRERALAALAAQIAEAMTELDEKDELHDRLAALHRELRAPLES